MHFCPQKSNYVNFGTGSDVPKPVFYVTKFVIYYYSKSILAVIELKTKQNGRHRPSCGK